MADSDSEASVGERSAIGSEDGPAVEEGALWIAQCEVTEGWHVVPVSDQPTPYSRARVLVRWEHQPIGFVEVPVVAGAVSEAQLRHAADQLTCRPLPSQEDIGHCIDGGTGVTSRPEEHEGGSESIDPIPWFTVAICTRDRPEALERCLRTVRQLEYSRFDVLVVDNAPTTKTTRTLVQDIARKDSRFHYVQEPVAGLSNARNRALRESTHPLVAFTDDDVVVDRWWLNGLAMGFAVGPHVACVTGLVPVARMATAAERYFDGRVSWSDHLQSQVFSLQEQKHMGALFPYQAGLFGTGANFAIDRDCFMKLGGFDANLGAGSPTYGGEDLDAFVRVLRSFRSLAYEPSAIVWHFHRSDALGLRRQMRDYGCGLGAVIAKWLSQPDTRREVLRRVPPALYHLWVMWARSARSEGSTGALGLTFAEAAGTVAGPIRYLRSQRAGHAGSDSLA